MKTLGENDRKLQFSSILRHANAVSLIFILLSSLIFGCSATTRGLLRSSSSYEDVFRASMGAVSDADFSVSFSDIKTGSIVAVKGVIMEGGNVMRMNILVSRMPNGTEVVVTVIPPPGTVTIGDQKGRVKSFVNALKRRVPDATIVSIE